MPENDADSGDFDERVGRIAALGEPVRRALYRYVATQHEPVGRDQAAEALGLPRHTAKFHLDRLETDGLLDAEYSRPPGRRGPGAGRPAKRYRRSQREVAVSLPARRYDVVGRVLARAISSATESGSPIDQSLHQVARAEGQALGRAVRARCADDPSDEAAVSAVTEILAEYGYEPEDGGGVVTLGNCPFHALAEEHRDLVCGVNLDLIGGLLESCGHGALHARLDPAPGRCCVLLDATSSS